MTQTKRLLAYRFSACAEEMGCVRQKLREALGGCCQDAETANNVVLAVGEACMNIIQHAYGPKDKGDIVLELELVETQGSAEGKCGGQQLVCTLTDFARHKTNAGEMRSRPLDEIRPGGLGCHIINQVMDTVELLEHPGCAGNILQLRKRLGG